MYFVVWEEHDVFFLSFFFYFLFFNNVHLEKMMKELIIRGVFWRARATASWNGAVENICVCAQLCAQDVPRPLTRESGRETEGWSEG